MVVSAIAARYSRALFEMAVESKAVEETMNDMNLIAAIITSNREMQRMLKSPVVKTDKKQTILKAIFGKHVSKLSMTYLLVITRKRRESYIHEIATEFVEIYKDYKGILTTQLKTAAPASDDIRKEVISLMKKQTGKEIDLVETIDEELIGGFLLNWKDMQYDATILNEINKLKRGVAKLNLYVRGI
jgi:F-type H+-transporting ATPase subunit delta